MFKSLAIAVFGVALMMMRLVSPQGGNEAEQNIQVRIDVKSTASIGEVLNPLTNDKVSVEVYVLEHRPSMDRAYGVTLAATTRGRTGISNVPLGELQDVIAGLSAITDIDREEFPFNGELRSYYQGPDGLHATFFSEEGVVIEAGATKAQLGIFSLVDLRGILKEAHGMLLAAKR